MSVDRMLDDLRTELTVKWTAIKSCLPSQNEAKSTSVTTSGLQPNYAKVQNNSHLCKMKVKLISDLLIIFPC
jgi:hypothetical protein